MDIVDIDQDKVQGCTGTVGHREDEGAGAGAGADADSNWMDQDQVEYKVMRGQPLLYYDHSYKSQDEDLCSLLLLELGPM